MNYEGLGRRIARLERDFSAFANALPAEKDLARILRRIRAEEVLETHAEWEPLVSRCMRQRGYGTQPSLEEVKEFLQSLRARRKLLPRLDALEDSVGTLLPIDELEGSSDSQGSPEDQDIADAAMSVSLRREACRWILESDPTKDWSHSRTPGVREVHTHQRDAKLQILLNLDGGGGDDAVPIYERWTGDGTPRRACAYRHRIYYGPVLIWDVYLVQVDGERTWIPEPQKTESSWVVSPFERKIAEIVGEADDLEQYMAKTGLDLSE